MTSAYPPPDPAVCGCGSGRDSCVRRTGGTTRGIRSHADEKGRFFAKLVGLSPLNLLSSQAGKRAKQLLADPWMTKIEPELSATIKRRQSNTVVVRSRSPARPPAPSAASATAWALAAQPAGGCREAVGIIAAQSIDRARHQLTIAYLPHRWCVHG